MGDIDLRFYLSIVRRRLPLLLLIAVPVAMIGLALALLLPPTYRASARILVEAPQISTEMARPTVLTSAIEQFEVIQQEIYTRERLLALAHRLNIYGSGSLPFSEDDVIDDLRGRIGLRQLDIDRSTTGPGAIVFNVSFEAGSPELAARVVNDLLVFIRTKNAGIRSGKAEDTADFFTKEVDRLGADLSAVEIEILRFKNANEDALPDSVDFRRNQRSNQQERLLNLDREEAALRSRRENMVRMYDATGQSAIVGQATPEEQTLQDLRKALVEQLSIYSDESPNVIALRKRIVAMSEGLTPPQTADRVRSGLSPLDFQLADLDDRLSTIGRERLIVTDEVKSLTASIGATSAVESKLNSMERKRANIQAQYNDATAKMAEASTGEQIELNAKGGRFTVVEPAVPPASPISPDKRKIAGMGLAGGLLSGLGLVFLLEFMDGSIRTPQQFMRRFQRRPLATVPYLWLAGERRSRRASAVARYASGVGAVLMICITFQQFSTPLKSAFENLLVSVDPLRAV